ncbi:hypothetical protein H0H93_005044 [Arthromyces matolae]|nr:hypothetical protein H0H93_005044 [Arthromyces matolae]
MARPPEQLRLNIPQLNMPQPNVGFQGQPMFSPIVQNYRPVFPMPTSLQTPMQPFFNPQPPPPAPGRPTHHPGRASIAHLASAGIHPPPHGFIPLGGGHFPRASMAGNMSGPPSAQPFPNRSRRQLSIGGPPKAVLGGPARKLSPLPVPPNPVTPPPKVKKVNIKLPQETILSEDGQQYTRASWARNLLDGFEFEEREVTPVDVMSGEVYPPDEWRNMLPDTLDVFLPGKARSTYLFVPCLAYLQIQRAWDAMKQKEIDAKLEKLGIERGFGSNVPHIHAPHARAASISSPADPQILLYKLSKLQQSQEDNGSVDNSQTSSPNPPLGILSSSPQRPSANRHGHSLSLAHPPSLSFNGSSFNPFGPNIELEVEPIPHSGADAFQESINQHAALTAPTSAARSTSRPDFIRGFGLDIPEEDEEAVAEASTEDPTDGAREQMVEYTPEQLHNYSAETNATASQSRFHSRHVSKLSAALSTQSAGALDEDHFLDDEELITQGEDFDQNDEHGKNLEEDVNEWTGSEDLYTGETSDGEQSIGEWSNPSDEERARKERVERRNRRRASAPQLDVPRRLPNFPRPPDNTIAMPLPVHHRDEEDIISNPSDEEGRKNVRRGEYLGIDYYSRSPSNLSGASRPLPPLPHSRGASAQHTAYDPAHAHSRATSDQIALADVQSTEAAYAPQPRRDALNPFAKPFIFGGRPGSGSWSNAVVAEAMPPSAPLLTHSRLPSLGKPLNVAAPEFKPGGFTFRPPAGVPVMVLPLTDTLQSTSEPTVEESPFKVQGREKRQRRNSSSSVEEGNSMVSFRFPANLDSPKSIHRSPTVRTHKLNPSAEPFTFAGFSAALATLPRVPREEDFQPEDASAVDKAPLVASQEETFNEESAAKADAESDKENEDIAPFTTKSRRAPIPLDFTHLGSKNTVPAGLFKALNSNNGEERRRHTVQSRLSSREIFDYSRRPSMDDSNVAQIANKGGRQRYVTDPGQSSGDVFATSHSRRRSSFTDAIRPLGRRLGDNSDADEADEVKSEMSLTGQLDIQEQVKPGIESLLETSFAKLMHDVEKQGRRQHHLLSEVKLLLKSTFNHAISRDEEQSKARGLDLQMITDVMGQSNKQLAQSIREELHDLQQQVWQTKAGDIVPMVTQLGDRTIGAVIEAISESSARQEAIIRSASAQERDVIVDNLVTVLTPLMGSLRAEPIDYEFLTGELAQAVKPHISQLIDLASDKQETAGLIMDRLIPMLPSPNLDIDAITQHLSAEVRRAIGPIDAFEIKEQVADLVVERLDSRLTVRDKAFNIDSLSAKITDSILELFTGISASLEQLKISQTSLHDHQADTSANSRHIVDLVSQLPLKSNEEMQSLRITQSAILEKLEQTRPITATDQNLLSVKSTVEEIAACQRGIASKADDLRALHQAFADKLDALPETMHAATDALQNNHVDFLKSHEATKRELDELRKANTDLQLQLTKARGAHGQIRVEKDVLNERLASTEREREKLRSQVTELQGTSADTAAQVNTVTAKNRELEDALATALTRLQASDVASQINQKRILELENERHGLLTEKQNLQAKVDSYERQVLTNRDKDSTAQALNALQERCDSILAQQSNWDELRRASEKIDALTNLIGQADSDELKELRRYRDRTKNLEYDNNALQKRLKELESKVGNSERAAATVKQSLAQAQQRSSEWERRAKESEAQLEMTRTKLEQAEQTQAQLDADYSLVKLQFEEREANDRLTQDQINKLREQISLLENKTVRLQSELDQANAIKAPVPQPYRNITNGKTHPPPRPDSRTSTVYIDRSTTPQQKNKAPSTVRSITPPVPTVWDSMHAPKTDVYKYATPTKSAPRNRYPNNGHTLRPQASTFRPTAPPSPTPSTVSLAPTQGEDGWWS